MEEKFKDAANQFRLVAMIDAIGELLVEKGIITEAEANDKAVKCLRKLLDVARNEISDDEKVIWDLFVKKMFGGDCHD